MGAAGSGGPADALPIPWVDDPAPSILSLLRKAPAFCEAVNALPDELVLAGETALEKKIRKLNGGSFDRLLGALKIQFWDEYKLAFLEKRMMTLSRVYDRLCHLTWFNKFVVANPLYLAWLITPPTDEIVLQREMIAMGMKKLRTVFDAPLYETTYKNVKNKDGVTELKATRKLNVALVREIHAILKTMQDRVHGAVLQRIKTEGRQLNVNVTAGAEVATPIPKGISLDSPDLTMEQLDAFAAKLGSVQKQLVESSAKEGLVLDAETVEEPAAAEEGQDSLAGNEESASDD